MKRLLCNTQKYKNDYRIHVLPIFHNFLYLKMCFYKFSRMPDQHFCVEPRLRISQHYVLFCIIFLNFFIKIFQKCRKNTEEGDFDQGTSLRVLVAISNVQRVAKKWKKSEGVFINYITSLGGRGWSIVLRQYMGLRALKHYEREWGLKISKIPLRDLWTALAAVMCI